VGLDCTLHVVDERSLARFSGRFLRGLHRGTAFDQAYDADDMIAKVKQLIARDPAIGARALAELALLHASTEAPHVCSRDFALSMWTEERMGAPLPAKWLGTVETRLPDILAAYPKLAGLIPNRIDGPYSVGPMVAARDVPALLAHLEHALEAMDAAARAQYQPLRDVLRVAASRNMAYWEGADIDVAQAHEHWLDAVRPARLTIAPNPLTSPLARPLAVAGTRMLVGEHFVLHELDTSVFPPAVITSQDMHVTAAAFTPWGTDFVRMATDRTKQPFEFAYYELPSRTPLELEPPFAIGLARSTKDCVVLFPQPTTRELADVRPLVMRPGVPPDALAVPPAAKMHRIRWDMFRFGDGTYLVVWDGVPYRWDGESAPVSLGGRLDASGDLDTAVVLADGSIVGAFGRRLVQIDRDGMRGELLPLDSVIAVAKGPGDVLIIVEEERVEDVVLKLWWPETREITLVRASSLGVDDRPTFVYFDEVAQLLVVARPGKWHALAWSECVAMRRIPEAELAAHRADRGPPLDTASNPRAST
jgi:hypothetical protein